MERGATMLIHSILIGIVIYLVLIFLFKQSPAVAEDRSVLVGAIALVYMVLWGHKAPSTTINPNITA
jgi:hypothetical protein